MTPELTWVWRAGLSERAECLLIVSAAFVWNKQHCKRTGTGVIYRPAHWSTQYISLFQWHTNGGRARNYTVACPLMTAQLCAHSTDHSRRTHWFFSDDSNNYTLKKNEQVGRTRDADDTFVPHVNAQSSQLFSDDTSSETSFNSKSFSNRVPDHWWRYWRDYTLQERDCGSAQLKAKNLTDELKQ